MKTAARVFASNVVASSSRGRARGRIPRIIWAPAHDDGRAAASPLSRHLHGRSSSSSTAGGAADPHAADSPPPPPTTTTLAMPTSVFIGSYVSGTTTHFGYESVSIGEKEGRVREVFANVAKNYDVMNDFMSGGLHRYWKDELLRMTGLKSMAGAVRRLAASSWHDSRASGEGAPLLSILDVAGGTGDVAFRFVDAADCVERAKSSGSDEVSVTVCDINPEMLRVGEARARRRYGAGPLDDSGALRFVEGNAQCLPFDGGSFDLYTIAFGLRNVTDVDAALRDALRVLKPGGRFLCLEFSRVTNDVPLLAELYDAYSFYVIPKLGEVVANDRDSYKYLVESIRKFCSQDELVTRMEAAGFEGVRYTNMTGGIVAVHEGWKPL
jgi:ubiquinone/menaquinone biosynthesis methyltransferase